MLRTSDLIPAFWALQMVKMVSPIIDDFIFDSVNEEKYA